MGFDEKALIQSLDLVPRRSRFAFAASCCETLLPNYRAFASTENWGDADVLDNAVALIWESSEGKDFSEKELQNLIKACHAVIPDSERFTSLFTGMAQNAAAAVIYTLTSLMEGETSRIALVGRLAVDSVIDYLYQVNDPDANVHGPNTVLDDWIQRAPLLAKELELQHNMLEELRSRTNMDPAFLLSLKLAARTRGVQPFARGIVKET